MTENDKLIMIAEFIKQHEKHQLGLGVFAALDICPDVIRLDCDDPNCNGNLQVPYVPSSKWMGTHAS